MAYLRNVTLFINFIPITGLRIDFEIIKTGKKEPNTAKIKVYNLGFITMNALSTKTNLPVQITAGHLDNPPGPIFIGRSKFIEVVEQEADTITVIEAYDDAFGVNQGAVVALPAGGLASSVVALMAAQSGAPLATPITKIGIYQNGFSFIGTIKRCLDLVVKEKLKMEWSIQNNLLYVLEPNLPKIAAPILLSPLNGLIGRVEKVKQEGYDLTEDFTNYYKFRVILLPRLGIGLTVTITSKDFIGALKIESMRYVGSTHENDYTIYCTGKKI